MKIIRIALPLILLLAVILFMLEGRANQTSRHNTHNHVFDEAGIIPPTDSPRFEWLLDLIEKESDIDIKFVFLKTIGNASIENVAVKKMDEYGIGRDAGRERGVLFLYVMDKKKLRIEVGYGLEGYLPDIFIGYLIRNQADAFFNASNPSMGLRLLIRILQFRLREAALHRDYDPSILQGGIRMFHESGGAGASAKVGTRKKGRVFMHDQYDRKDKERLSAANTVKGTYNNYINWFYGRKYDPNVDLFTKASIPYLNKFPMTPAYFDYLF